MLPSVHKSAEPTKLATGSKRQEVYGGGWDGTGGVTGGGVGTRGGVGRSWDGGRDRVRGPVDWPAARATLEQLTGITLKRRQLQMV